MQKLPSLTTLKQLLVKCAFDPRADGPSRIIVETATDNPRYAELRAIELIRQGMLSLDSGGGVDNYRNSIDQAIGLLALARAVRG